MSYPEPSSLAAYVLRVGSPVDQDGNAYPEPGSFYASLVETFMLADPLNRMRLSLGFPVLDQMVTAYKDDPTGIHRLREAVRTNTW